MSGAMDSGAGEDRAERLGLFIVSAFIDVSADRPVAFGHWPGGMDHERHVEAVKRHAAIAASLDMEEQRQVTHALGWSRGQRRNT